MALGKIIKIDNHDFPIKQNVFVDTNVIYWMTYASARHFPGRLKPLPYQIPGYSSLMEKLMNNDNKLFFSNYSIPELVHLVCRVEATLDSSEAGHLKKKWLQEKGRDIVSKEIESLLEVLTSWATPLKTTVAYSHDEYLTEYSKYYLDGYDLILLKELSENGISLVLTDDLDFSTIPQVTVITANKTA